MKPVPTTQRTQSLSVTNSNRLMLFKIAIEIYLEDQMRYKYTLCGKTQNCCKYPTNLLLYLTCI